MRVITCHKHNEIQRPFSFQTNCIYAIRRQSYTRIYTSTPPYAMEAYGRMDVEIHVFLTSALVGGEWSDSRPCRFTPRGKSSRCPLDRKLVGPQRRLDDVEQRKFLTLQALELRPLGRPARSQSLYRLRYPGGLFDSL
jgi:hypothetical protein